MLHNETFSLFFFFFLSFQAPLALAGLTGVTMSLAITTGISTLMGIPYTNMTMMVAVLTLGLGIDDMFVIVQCHENIMDEADADGEKEEELKDLPRHIGKVMARAGAAITLTSVTDFIAFAIGLLTVTQI